MRTAVSTSGWTVATGGIAAAFLMTLGMRLTGEERERSRMREMFGRYVSDEVVDVLLADDRKLDLAGESKVVTVLFSDIRGFTTISEKLSPVLGQPRVDRSRRRSVRRRSSPGCRAGPASRRRSSPRP